VASTPVAVHEFLLAAVLAGHGNATSVRTVNIRSRALQRRIV
jgi:hypothetical protein